MRLVKTLADIAGNALVIIAAAKEIFNALGVTQRKDGVAVNNGHAVKLALVKAFMKTLWLTGKIATKIIPVESKLLSPYIVLKAIK